MELIALILIFIKVLCKNQIKSIIHRMKCQAIRPLHSLFQGFRHFLYYFQFMNHPYHYRGPLKHH